MCRSTKLLVVLMILLMQPGCGTVEKPELLTPPFEAVGPGVVRAGELWPVEAHRRPVTITDRGESHEATDVAAEVGPGIWRLSVSGFWVVDVLQNEDGEVSAIREVEPAEERRLEYDPPLPLLPAELRMGKPVTLNRDVQLYNHANGTLEATGSVTVTYELLGKKVLAPGGLLPADAPEESVYVVQTERRYDLPLVVVDMKILSAYKPGVGPVAGRTVRVVKLFGLLPIEHVQGIEQR